ncbi:hypothetical protein, partial [Rubrivivax gelatinosus]|uniref:hypothetical protein n=1 Tax=Rubrivivax gelatinosus TaxID=28068 RepID=UPI0005C20432
MELDHRRIVELRATLFGDPPAERAAMAQPGRLPEPLLDGAALKVERRLVLALQESKEARDPRRLGIAAAWS